MTGSRRKPRSISRKSGLGGEVISRRGRSSRPTPCVVNRGVTPVFADVDSDS